VRRFTFGAWRLLFFDEHGTFEGAIESIRDITEWKKAENSLRSSEEKFHSLYDNMLEGVALHELVYDENGRPIEYRICGCEFQV